MIENIMTNTHTHTHTHTHTLKTGPLVVAERERTTSRVFLTSTAQRDGGAAQTHPIKHTHTHITCMCECVCVCVCACCSLCILIKKDKTRLFTATAETLICFIIRFFFPSGESRLNTCGFLVFFSIIFTRFAESSAGDPCSGSQHHPICRCWT